MCPAQSSRSMGIASRGAGLVMPPAFRSAPSYRTSARAGSSCRTDTSTRRAPSFSLRLCDGSLRSSHPRKIPSCHFRGFSAGHDTHAAVGRTGAASVRTRAGPCCTHESPSCTGAARKRTRAEHLCTYAAAFFTGAQPPAAQAAPQQPLRKGSVLPQLPRPIDAPIIAASR